MDISAIFRQEFEGLWASGKGISLSSLAVTWGLLLGARMIYPVIIPYLQTAYGLSLTIAGLLVTVLWLFGSLGQLPGGILADRYDERILLVASPIIVAMALTLIISTGSVLILFLSTALWGLGHSIFPIARITLLSDLYSERIGSALGVVMATGDIGQTVLPPIAALLAASVAWQASLGFLTPLLIVSGFVILITIPAQNSMNTSGKKQPFEEIIEVLTEIRNPTMGIMAVIMFLFGLTWQSFTAFYPTYLTNVKELSPTVTSVLFGFFFAMGIIIKPVSGMAYDRIGMRASLIGVLVPPIGGLLILPYIDSFWPIVVITALISLLLGGGTITQSYLAEKLSDKIQGTGLGVIRTTSFTLAAGGPVIFGGIADQGYFDEGYFALAIIIMIVVLLTFKLH